MNKAEFQAHFAEALQAIAGAERVTKEQLRVVSRTLLEAIHGVNDQLLTGDIQYINQLLVVLTPMNKKTAVLFFKEFTGFHYDDKEQVFTKKSAKAGVKAQKDALEFLSDPHNNIWTWAERNVDVERKPFKVTKLTKDVEKAIAEGIPQLEILQAVIEGGVDVDAIVLLMEELAKQEPAPAPLPDAPI